jgi:hypothetical protein
VLGQVAAATCWPFPSHTVPYWRLPVTGCPRGERDEQMYEVAFSTGRTNGGLRTRGMDVRHKRDAPMSGVRAGDMSCSGGAWLRALAGASRAGLDPLGALAFVRNTGVAASFQWRPLMGPRMESRFRERFRTTAIGAVNCGQGTRQF